MRGNVLKRVTRIAKRGGGVKLIKLIGGKQKRWKE